MKAKEDQEMNKKELRRRLIAARLEIPEDRRMLFSEAICRELTEKYEPTLVCSYVAYRGEVDLGNYHEYLIAAGVPLLLPRVEDQMVFYEVKRTDDLIRSKLGIMEPNPDLCRRWSYEEIWEGDPLILTPGVAFTKEGARMGYGGGYYDRFFSASSGRGRRIGICYRLQLQARLPIEPHDHFVDEVVFFPKKAVIGLSGGVDSAVAASLLLRSGYEVIGAWLGMWRPEQDRDNQVAAVDELDARLVAERLGIPFLSCDCSAEFKEKVVRYFVDEYLRGRTPNPCTFCNRNMKFEKLLDIARKNDADCIATGHYARIHRNKRSGRYEIVAPSDAKKDQGYMLSRLTQEQLAHLVTPLAEMENKEEVRRLAAEMGLHISEKKDSQEICFVDGAYTELLHTLGAEGRRGDFMLDGEKVGEHAGIEKYTIGQRKGLGAFGRPVFVVDIDPERGSVVLGSNDALFSREVFFGEMHAVAMADSQELSVCLAKIRYAARKEPCRVEILKNGYGRAVFDEPQRAATPGQIIVFYRGDCVLASGVIVRGEDTDGI